MAAVGEDSGEAVLAPMVRLGTLPLRLLALERGAALDCYVAGNYNFFDFILFLYLI